jgi:hypothetical protein
MGCKSCTQTKNVVNDEQNQELLDKINYEIKTSKNSNQPIDYDYFSRPVRNAYLDQELLDMSIIEILLGIHLTKISGKSKEKGEKSFHSFFYIKLKNNKNMGVIVQYIVLPKDDINIQTHLVGDNGIEYLEKDWSNFEKEYLYFIQKVSKEDLTVYDWVIKYDKIDLRDINTLREFFILINPVAGVGSGFKVS